MTSENQAFEQAKAQAESIIEMVAALECDYDRLVEMQDERDNMGEEFENSEELAKLKKEANGCDSQEDAGQRIQDDPLSIEVRNSEWANVGEISREPTEFQILLCTGGPAVRIIGELNEHLEPSRAWLEYQDWGTPWTQAIGVVGQSTLITYCQQFYFGE